MAVPFQPTPALMEFPQQMIALRQLGEQQRIQNQVMDLNRQPGMVEGGLYTDQGLMALGQIAPALRDQEVQKRSVVLAQRSQEALRKAQADDLIAEQRRDYIDDEIMGPATAAYYTATGSEEERRRKMMERIQQGIADMRASGTGAKYGMTEQNYQAMLRHTNPEDITLKLLAHKKEKPAEYLMRLGAEKEIKEGTPVEEKPQEPVEKIPLSQLGSVKETVDPMTGAIIKPTPEAEPAGAVPLPGEDVESAAARQAAGQPAEVPPQVSPTPKAVPEAGVGGKPEKDFYAMAEEEQRKADIFESKGLKKDSDQHAKTAQQYLAKARGQEEVELKRQHEARLKEKQAQTAPGAAPRVSRMSEEAIRTAAFQYNLTGQLPQNIARSYKGEMGPEARDIINAAAEEQKKMGISPQDMAYIRANNKSLAPALAQLQKQSNAIEAFERTLQANVAAASELSKKVWRTGSPWLNRPLIELQKQGLGDPDTQRLLIRNEAIAAEVGKIMSGSMGNAQLAQSAQDHARELLNSSMSDRQYQAAIDEISKEVEQGRVTGMRAQTKQMLRQMTTPGTENVRIPTPGAATTPAATPMFARNPKTGERIQSNDGGATWQPVR